MEFSVAIRLPARTDLPENPWTGLSEREPQISERMTPVRGENDLFALGERLFHNMPDSRRSRDPSHLHGDLADR
jgi:hypothetical protein